MKNIIITRRADGKTRYENEREMLDQISQMLAPVQCNRCGKPYDLCNTEVVNRYADCTEYITPCCNRRVDDREWVAMPAFTRIKK